MKKKQFFGLGVGLSSVVMIFVVLCLTTLAVLGYFCAKADTKLTEKKVSYAFSYQEADVKAKKVLSKIDEVLLLLYRENKSITEFNNIYKGDTQVSFIEEKYLYYEVKINDSIALCVKLQINLDDNNYIATEKERYIISQWKTVNVGYELEDEVLNLWGN